MTDDPQTFFISLQPVHEKTIALMRQEKYPVFLQDGGRTPADQKRIYPAWERTHPQEPVRWSLHLPGLAGDYWPLEWHRWRILPPDEYKKRFNGWSGWEILHRIAPGCGWEPDRLFQRSDLCHLQQTYGLEATIRGLYFAAQDHHAGVKSVWDFLLEHGK